MAKEDIIEHQFDKRTAGEQQEIARQGGKASGRSRRRKRQFRDELEMLLPLTDKGKDGQPIINPLTGRKQTVQQSITMQLLLKARKGDVKAAKLIFEVLGERLLRAEETHEVTVRQTRYDNMTDEELQAENKRLDDAINNL
jgi:hypothetical protein